MSDVAEKSTSAELQGVSRTFVARGKSVDAIKDVDLSIRTGEYVVILGPSGCGKTTLLRCLAGLEDPSEGRISLSDVVVYDSKKRVNMQPNLRNVGMVFQNYALWPHMTVEENVMYPLKMRGVSRPERAKLAKEVLQALECEAVAKRLPVELSGGQQQRIALARALVYKPGILLLDEPLSNLDALLRVSLRTELLRLHRLLGFTAIHITHDQEEALEMGDRVVLMRQGRIEQIGSPAEVYARPVSPYAATFLGVRNRITVSQNDGDLEYAGKIVGGGPWRMSDNATGEQVQLFARGRDTHLRRGPSGEGHRSTIIELQGVVTQSVLGDGGRRQYIVDVGGAQWFADGAVGDEYSPGEAVYVVLPRASVLLYRGDALVYPRPADADVTTDGLLETAQSARGSAVGSSFA